MFQICSRSKVIYSNNHGEMTNLLGTVRLTMLLILR